LTSGPGHTNAAEQGHAGGERGVEHDPARDSLHTIDPADRIRVVVAKPGLDGHDRGAKIVARALRDAGMEVIYTGLHQTPEQIVEAVIQEDADAVGLSVLSGAHMTLFARTMELLHDRGVDDVVVFGGGIIPTADLAPLADLGVARIFTPGAPMAEIVDWVRTNVGTASDGETVNAETSDGGTPDGETANGKTSPAASVTDPDTSYLHVTTN
jgi:methylmalonyl-CoA mutase, C-terminal domain